MIFSDENENIFTENNGGLFDINSKQFMPEKENIVVASSSKTKENEKSLNSNLKQLTSQETRKTKVIENTSKTTEEVCILIAL